MFVSTTDLQHLDAHALGDKQSKAHFTMDLSY